MPPSACRPHLTRVPLSELEEALVRPDRLDAKVLQVAGQDRPRPPRRHLHAPCQPRGPRR